MFPLPIILIGVSEHELPGLRKELANASANVEAEYGKSETVIQALSGKEAEKRLFIVAFESAQDAPLIGKLASAFRNWPILALVGGSQLAENLILANRAGAVQVVAVPVQSSDLRAALKSIALSYRPVEQDSLVLAFTSSGAGCGTTTLATNTAYEIAERYERQTVLIELASQMGVVASNVGIETPRTLADLLADQEHLDAELVKQALVPVTDHLRILGGSRDVLHHGSVSVAGVLRVLDYMRAMANVIVLDVPCTYDDFQFEMLGCANHVILVGEQSITSVRTLKLILDALSKGASSASYHVVLNRYNPAVGGLGVRDIQRVLGVSKIHTIPDDRLAVLTAANEGKLLRQVDPDSPLLSAIDALVDCLLKDAAKVKLPASKSLMSRLFHSFTK